MDDTTQQNAALVEEAAAAAESLQEQAEELAKAVSVFKLSGSAGREVALPRNASMEKHEVGSTSDATPASHRLTLVR